MKIRYCYNNDTIKEHTTFIKRETIDREKGDATKVTIYKGLPAYRNGSFWDEQEQYITTLSLT